MPPGIDAADLASRLIGQTLATPARERPNVVLDVQGSDVIIGTQASPAGEPVSLPKLQQALDLLTRTGEVRIEPRTFDGYRRSSAIGALIAQLHGTELSVNPIVISLSSDTPIRDLLARACQMVTTEPDEPTVASTAPRYRLFTKEIPEAFNEVVDQNLFLVKGSAGQVNFLWAETPWVAILDRIVTSSPQQGHYLVYLVHPKGSGVYLSLNQGVTEHLGEHGSQVSLETEATRLRLFMPKSAATSLLSKIDLGGLGRRTRAYEAANVTAVFYRADEIPHDAVLINDLERMQALYSMVTEGLDATGDLTDPNIPVDAQSGLEAKRYRWHVRAEGRNSSLARRAKELGNYTCQVCGREFLKELGKRGKNCIEAHHLTPFRDLDSHPKKLDPSRDFAVVCANCHRLLHSETPPLSPARLRQILRGRRRR